MYSIDFNWLEDKKCIEYTIYRGLNPLFRTLIVSFCSDVISSRKLEVVVKLLCSAYEIQYDEK